MAIQGDIGKTQNIEVIARGIASGVTITKGDIVSFDANGYCILATTSTQRDVGLAVAIETVVNSGADNAKTVRLAIGDTWVYVTAGAAIKPNKYVKFLSGATGAMKVTSHSAPASVTPPGSTDVDNATKFLGLCLGRYIAHENEEANATDAADTDVILVRLGP